MFSELTDVENTFKTKQSSDTGESINCGHLNPSLVASNVPFHLSTGSGGYNHTYRKISTNRIKHNV